MKTIIFDIETVGEKFEEMDATTQHNLTKWYEENSESEEDFKNNVELLKKRLGFSPLHGEIVSIGLLDADSDSGAVYYQSPDVENITKEIDGIKFEAMLEEEILKKFWEVVSYADKLVGFNSRSFDAPFINIRSAIHEIRPSKDIMSGRYLYQQHNFIHIDLMDQLSYYGAVWKKGSLHLWCRAFEIESPKSGGVTGEDVGKLFNDKKYFDIAKYNGRDLFATRELYRHWNKYLNFQIK